MSLAGQLFLLQMFVLKCVCVCVCVCGGGDFLHTQFIENRIVAKGQEQKEYKL